MSSLITLRTEPSQLTTPAQCRAARGNASGRSQPLRAVAAPRHALLCPERQTCPAGPRAPVLLKAGWLPPDMPFEPQPNLKILFLLLPALSLGEPANFLMLPGMNNVFTKWTRNAGQQGRSLGARSRGPRRLAPRSWRQGAPPPHPLCPQVRHHGERSLQKGDLKVTL